MKWGRAWFLLLAALAAGAALRKIPAVPSSSPQIELLRTPGGGIQPRAVADATGTLHVIYFTGEAVGGDLYYVRRAPGTSTFSAPIRVNSTPGSALAIGSVRGAQMALGRGRRVHVMWVGSKKAKPRATGGAIPVLYTRLNDAGTAFEPERNVVQFAVGLDGGGAVAADPQGNVYVVWHSDPGTVGETQAQVWVALSHDDGKTFDRERSASPGSKGACGCCSMSAFADHMGTVFVLYRTAAQGIHRDMDLEESQDRGESFLSGQLSAARFAQWQLNACPMTTADLTEAGSRLLMAWETAGQVYFGQNSRETGILRLTPAPGSADDRKHPSVAGNTRGETLLAWTEGTGWGKGGKVAWQMFDAAGHTTEVRGSAPGVPVWGLVAACPRPDGGFTILY